MQSNQDDPEFPERKTNFQLTITKDKQGEDKAIMSATFSGKLKGIMGSPDVEVTNGKFENIEVKVFTEKY